MELIRKQIALFSAKFDGHKLEAGLFTGSLCLCLAGLLLLVVSFMHPGEIGNSDYYKASKETTFNTHQKVTGIKDRQAGGAGEIAVDIAGAVNRPGVYYLPQPARLNDLLEKAEGLSEQANHVYVSRSLNLAKTLSDQDKIYIPSLGEEAPEFSNNQGQIARVQNSADILSEGPLLNINSASKAELEDLPGIGQITAEKIIEGRPYSSVEELSNNGILKPNVFSDIKAKISI
jgi:competence protein ComEA